jgi:hypothetical protein
MLQFFFTLGSHLKLVIVAGNQLNNNFIRTFKVPSRLFSRSVDIFRNGCTLWRWHIDQWSRPYFRPSHVRPSLRAAVAWRLEANRPDRTGPSVKSESTGPAVAGRYYREMKQCRYSSCCHGCCNGSVQSISVADAATEAQFPPNRLSLWVSRTDLSPDIRILPLNSGFREMAIPWLSPAGSASFVNVRSRLMLAITPSFQ